MTAGPSIDTETLTYLQSVLETTTPVHPSLRSATDAFSASFHRWNPKTILDILIQDKDTIDFLFSPVTTDTSLDSYTKQVISNFQNTIHKITNAWYIQYQEYNIPKDDLQQLLLTVQAGLWDTYRNYVSVNELPNGYEKIVIPTDVELQTRITEMGEEERLVNSYLIVQVLGTSYKLVDFLSQNYCSTTITRTKKSTSTSVSEDILDGSNLVQQLERLRYVFGSNKDSIYQLMYFYNHPSLLFGDVKYSIRNKNILEVIAFVNDRNKSVVEVFGSEMNYQSVGNALQQHLKTEDDIQKEIITILNCKVLQISALDVTHFRVVQLLHDIRGTLQDFIDACILYKFNVVVDDLSFDAFKEMVSTFYSAENNDRQSCVSFINQLYTVLVDPELINNDPVAANDLYISLLFKIQHLKEICTKGLKLMSHALHGPELWDFFSEMKWFRDKDSADEKDVVIVNSQNEGLVRFYENFDALDNILNQYGATNERLIVAEIEPVARLFSMIQSTETVTSLFQLIVRLMKVYNNDDGDMDAQDVMLTEQNVHELNSRVVSVKDLFVRVCGIPRAAITTEDTP